MHHVTLDRSEATFVDFGSGKGRALFLAAACGFRRIVGVEVLEVLHKVALENIGKYKTATGNSVPIEPVLSDVASFAIPAGPLLAYFYNPFGERTMKRVIRNLEEAHARTGQRIDIAYSHPSCESLLDEQHWLRKTGAFDAVLTPEERARCVMNLDSLRIACYSTFAG
jgi:predicted RNA methylase